MGKLSHNDINGHLSSYALFPGLLSFSWDIYPGWERTVPSPTCTARTLLLSGLQIFSGDFNSAFWVNLSVKMFFMAKYLTIYLSLKNVAGLNRLSQRVSAAPLLSWKCVFSRLLWSSSLITWMFCSVPNSALWSATAQVRNEPRQFSSHQNWFLDETLLMRILNELITLTWIHRPHHFSSTQVTTGELSIHQAAFSGGSPGPDSSPAHLSRVSWQQVYRCGRGACRPAGQVPHRHRLPFWEVCQFVLVLVFWYFFIIKQKLRCGVVTENCYW